MISSEERKGKVREKFEAFFAKEKSAQKRGFCPIYSFGDLRAL